MSTDALAIEFTDPSGDALRIEWRTDALAALDPGSPGQEPAWRLGGELDWDEVEALRVISARLEDGRLIAVAALRPAGAVGHGEEIVLGALGDAESFDQLDDALFSTEYGPDELPRRVGLELYRENGGLPVRIAGDAVGVARSSEGGVERVSSALALRATGDAGVGVLDVLRRS